MKRSSRTSRRQHPSRESSRAGTIARRYHRRRRQPRTTPPARRLDRALDVLQHAITVAGVVGVAYFVGEAVAALAGETTAAKIAFRVFANVPLSEGLAWLFGASGIGFGYLQRGLHQRTRRKTDEVLRRPRERVPDRSKGGPR